jgi:hypothetical protein
MQIKGSKYIIFGTHQIPPNLYFASHLAKQNQSMKHKSVVVGETIAFSICNKPFKPLGLPSGRVMSCEDLPEMIPTNIEALCCQQERIFTQTMVLIHEQVNKMNITSLGPQKSFNS